MRCVQCKSRVSRKMDKCPVCHERVLYQVEMVAKPYGLGNATVLLEASENQELQKLNKKSKMRKKWIVIAAGIVLLACIGFITVWQTKPSKNNVPLSSFSQVADTEEWSILPEVHQAFYQTGQTYLEEYTSAANATKAKEIGAEAFMGNMDKLSDALLNYGKEAQTENERIFAETVHDLSLYALSIDASAAMVEELGGGQSEEDTRAMQERRVQVEELKTKLLQAKTLEEVHQVQTVLDQKTA